MNRRAHCSLTATSAPCCAGHERPDVVADRVAYCRENEVRRPRMKPITQTCEGRSDCKECCGKGCVKLGDTVPDENAAVPDVEPGVEIVRVFHDECICGSNEGRRSYWGQQGDRFFHKSKGQSIMISGFICPCHGRMEIPPDQMPAFKAFCHNDARFKDLEFKMSEVTTADGEKGLQSFTTIAPGKNNDGWWRGEDVASQLEEVVAIFEFLHSAKSKALFVFDNSTNHSCVPPGALGVGSGVNKGPGGINAPGAMSTNPKIMPGASAANPIMIPKMRDGWTMVDGTMVVQSMHDEAGMFKGTENILIERGLISKEDKLKGDCKAKAGEERPAEKCCCRHVLLDQPDFKSQPSLIEELVARMGHFTRMLPKCHPELNPIEQFWAAVKEWLRRNCGYTFAELRKNVPIALRVVPVEQVQRYFRRAERFEALYLFEADGKMELPPAVREYAMKKFKRHRIVPGGLLAQVTSDLEARVAKLSEKAHKGPGKLTQTRLERAKATLAELRQVPAAAGAAPMEVAP